MEVLLVSVAMLLSIGGAFLVHGRSRRKAPPPPSSASQQLLHPAPQPTSPRASGSGATNPVSALQHCVSYVRGFWPEISMCMM